MLGNYSMVQTLVSPQLPSMCPQSPYRRVVVLTVCIAGHLQGTPAAGFPATTGQPVDQFRMTHQYLPTGQPETSGQLVITGQPTSIVTAQEGVFAGLLKTSGQVVDAGQLGKHVSPAVIPMAKRQRMATEQTGWQGM